MNAELEKIEKPAGISNPKDFRNEIVNFVLRARANNGGKNPTWTSYEKLRTVIEKKMFSNTEELLPVISFNAKASAEDAKKHEDFVNRMVEKATPPSRCACCANGICGCASPRKPSRVGVARAAPEIDARPLAPAARRITTAVRRGRQRAAAPVQAKRGAYVPHHRSAPQRQEQVRG